MTLRSLWIGTLVLAGMVGSTPAGGPVAAAIPASSLAPPAVLAPPAPGGPGYRSVRTYPSVAVPTRLRIPAVGIDTTLLRLGLTPDGTIAAPGEWQRAGWYTHGPRPGQLGPAVIVGHVDSRSGPAVFFRLPELTPGAAVYVDRIDGTSVRFRVTGRQQVPKEHFPADLVYAPTLTPSLVLMTCGGGFDPATGHYRDNVLVSAVPG